MKVNAVIVKNKKDKNNKPTANAPLILSVIAVLSGLSSGVLIYCFFKESLSMEILELFTSFFWNFKGKTAGEVISGLILSALPYIFLMFIFAMDVTGAPLCLALTFFKALAPTLLFSYLYEAQGLKGVEYVFLVLAAGEIFSISGTLFITSCSYRMSRITYNMCLKEKEKFPQEMRDFILRFSVGTGIIIISKIVTFVSVTVFGDLFTF